jgi:solute carrier family 35 protein E1
MTTTTVTGIGRRSSIRQTEIQPPAKAPNSQSVTSPIDQFPPFDEGLYQKTTESGEPQSNPTSKHEPSDHWQPRKAGYLPRDYTKGPIRPPKHRSRKSISEAITTIRTRNASVSANAQELAQALRAPVSYRLIVRSFVLALLLF